MKKITPLIIALFILLLGSAAWMKSQPQNARTDTSENAIRSARGPIVAELKDPGSVQFRNEVLQADGVTVCGEFNAKNSFGGYVGFKKYASNTKHYIIENGRFETWPIHGVPGVAPEGYADAIDKASKNPDLMILIRHELWDWYWKSLCPAK